MTPLDDLYSEEHVVEDRLRGEERMRRYTPDERSYIETAIAERRYPDEDEVRESEPLRHEVRTWTSRHIAAWTVDQIRRLGYTVVPIETPSLADEWTAAMADRPAGFPPSMGRLVDLPTVQRPPAVRYMKGGIHDHHMAAARTEEERDFARVHPWVCYDDERCYWDGGT